MKKFNTIISFTIVYVILFSVNLNAGGNIIPDKSGNQTLTWQNNSTENMISKVFSNSDFLKKRRGSNKGTVKIIAGLNGGLNVSTVSGDVDHQSTTTGFMIGVFGAYMIIPKIGVQIEFNSDPKGYTSDQTQTNMGITSETKEKATFKYITIPVMVRFAPGDGKFYINAGPYFSFLSSAKDEITYTVSGASSTTDIDIKDSMTKSDFGFTVGVGCMIPVYETSSFDIRVLGDFRLSTGLTNANSTNDNKSVKNQAGTIKVGAAITLK